LKEYTREDVNKVWPSVGMRCVCTHSFHMTRKGSETPPMRGQVLTVRSVRPGTPSDTSPAFLRFEEIHNAPDSYSDGYLECDYGSLGFRPLAAKTIEDDLAVFHPLLTNLPIYELAAEEAGSNVDRVDGLLLALNRAWALYGVEE
jgi:hypothetical protein